MYCGYQRNQLLNAGTVFIHKESVQNMVHSKVQDWNIIIFWLGLEQRSNLDIFLGPMDPIHIMYCHIFLFFLELKTTYASMIEFYQR